MDSFSDIFEEPSMAKAPAGKFQPKAKPRPRKPARTAVAPVPMTNSHETKEKVLTQACSEPVAGQHVQPFDVADKKPESAVLPPVVLADTSVTEEPLEGNKDTNSRVFSMEENKNSRLVNSLSQHEDSSLGAEIPVFDENRNLDITYTNVIHSQIQMSNGDCPSYEKPGLESADIYSELEFGSFDDFINPSASDTENLHTEVGTDDHMGNKFEYPVHNDGEGSFPAPTLHDSGDMDSQQTSDVHISSTHLPTYETCDTAEAQPSADYITQVQGTCSETAACNKKRESELDTQKSQAEFSEIGVADFEIVDMMPQVTTLPGSRTGKYQPRPKVQNRKPKTSTSIPGSNAISFASCPSDAQLQSPATGQVDEGSNHTCQPDGDSLPADYSCGTHQELTNCAETSQPDVPVSEDRFPPDVPVSDDLPPSAVPEKGTKNRKRSSKISDYSQEFIKPSVPREENGEIKTRKRQKKSVLASSPDDESEDGTRYTAGSHDEYPAYSVESGDGNGNDDDDDEYKGENKARKKRAPRKGNKSDGDANTAQKRSRGSTEPKKFPHATQRKRRCVDKSLLDIPEDEIDYRNLPIKDLIILAEVREKLASKASGSNAPAASESSGNPVDGGFDDNENGFTSQQDEDNAADQETIRVQQDASYFNYHSFMDRTRSARWSKQETEMFYEGVRQFGSDLSMIQQLFPGRTRNQVKLKYKSEERKHPLRLHEALANRAKDFTHFQRVIEQLQQVADQVERDSNGNDSMGGAEAEELATEANGEAAEPKQDEEDAEPKQDEEAAVENNVAEVQSSLEAEEVEDDIWSCYKSEY